MTIPADTLACHDFIVRAVRALDERDYETVALGFAETGIWERGGEHLAGPAAVRQAMQKRPADLETQHLVFNVVVDLDGENAALVRYTMLAYAQTNDLPYHVHGLFKAEDHLVRTGDGWRFARRRIEPAFQART